MDNWDYYIYLLKISWPALLGLTAVFLFLGARCYLAVVGYISSPKTGSSPKTSAGILALLFRVALTFIVFFIYSLMFIQSYADWGYRPSQFKGIITELKNEPEGGRYTLTLKNEQETLTVSIDGTAYNKLYQDDLVEVAYLPVKKEVFRCTVLTGRT